MIKLGCIYCISIDCIITLLHFIYETTGRDYIKVVQIVVMYCVFDREIKIVIMW